MQKSDSRGKAKAVAGFGERMNTAVAAKKALLEKWRDNKVDVTDPAFLERQAARLAAEALRVERDSQRKAEKDAAKAQAIADRQAAQIAADRQAVADLAAREAAKLEAAAALIVRDEERKAARDARYAARKARK
jgi:hydroxylamine reductase (hybrid-cluster protein)